MILPQDKWLWMQTQRIRMRIKYRWKEISIYLRLSKPKKFQIRSIFQVNSVSDSCKKNLMPRLMNYLTGSPHPWVAMKMEKVKLIWWKAVVVQFSIGKTCPFSSLTNTWVESIMQQVSPPMQASHSKHNSTFTKSMDPYKVKEWSMNFKLLKTIEEAKPWLITKAILSKWDELKDWLEMMGCKTVRAKLAQSAFLMAMMLTAKIKLSKYMYIRLKRKSRNLRADTISRILDWFRHQEPTMWRRSTLLKTFTIRWMRQSR